MSIDCERCDNAMQTVYYEGIAIKLCFNCKGIFLNKKKLEAIEESQEIRIPEDTPKPMNGPEVLRSCPTCSTVMAKRKHGKIRVTTVDYCEDCDGIWLDKGELASIQLGYEIAKTNKLRNQFRRI